MKRLWFSFLLLALFFVSSSGAWGQIWRVDVNTPLQGQPFAQDGLSWATAFETLQAGIDAAFGAGGGELWVADGVYDENRTEDWGDVVVKGSLVLKDNVELYGGFTGYEADPWLGNETARNQRSITRNITVISGATARNGNRAYHTVVVGKETGPTTGVRLDGFHVTDGGDPNVPGVGNLYHTYRGGGLFNYGSQPVIANCTFYNNTAPVSGGAIANEHNPLSNLGGNALIVNCVFFNNTANRLPDDFSNPIRGGGAVFNNSNNPASPSSPTLVHCTFYTNTIGNPGYAAFGANSEQMYNWNSILPVTHSIFWTNGIKNEGEFNLPATPWNGGASLSECDVIGGYACPSFATNGPDPGVAAGFGACGTGNFSANPSFVSTGPEFPIAAGSPCENAGSATALPQAPTDIQGLTRPVGGAVDIGAFEGNGVLTAPSANINDEVLQSLVNYTPETYNFDNLGSTGSLNARYYWDVDGDNAEDYGIENPSHNYTSPGTYAVTLWVTNGVGDATDSVTVDLEPPVTAGPPSPLNPAAIDNYQPITFTVSGTEAGGFAPPYNYQWQFSTNGSSWGVTFRDGTTLTNGAHVSTRAGRNPDIDPLVDPINAYLVDVDWNLSGANGPTLTIDHALANVHNGFYRCIVWDTMYESIALPEGRAITVSTTLNVTDRVEVIRQPVGGQYYDGNEEQIDVVAFGGTDPANYQYQWRLGTIFIQNSSRNPYPFFADIDPPVVVPGGFAAGTGSQGNYNVQVNDPSTNTARQSASGFVEVRAAVTLTTPLTNQTENVTETATFAVVAAGGYPAVGGYAYAWTWNGQPLSDGTGSHPSGSNATISGATTATLQVSDLEEADFGTYAVVVSDSKAPCPLANNKCQAASSATLTVTNNILISDQPDDLDVYDDDTVSFSVVAVGGDPPSYEYDWFWDFGEGPVSLNDGPHPSGSGANITGSDTATISIANVRLTGVNVATGDAGQYYCIVGDTPPQNAAGQSDPAQLDIFAPIEVTLDPAAVNVYENDAAVFTVAATGGVRDDRSFQWEVDTGSGFGVLNDGGNVSGSDTATLTVSPASLADNGNRYRCVVTAPTSDVPTDPANTTDTSADALLQVSTALVILDEPADVQAYVTDPVFVLRTHFEGGMPSFSTDWRRVGIDPVGPEVSVGAGSIILGTPNTALLSVNPGSVSPGVYDYSVDISDQVATSSSGTGRVEIANNLAFTQPLTNAFARKNQEFEWTIVVTGGLGTLQYQWYKDDGSKAFSQVPEDAFHVGTHTASLTFTQVADEDAGLYMVEVSDLFTSISSQAVLTVGTAVPVTGVFGLAVLAMASALGGASALRRRKR